MPESEKVAWILNSNEIRIRAIGEHTMVISHSLFNNLNENIELEMFKKPVAYEIQIWVLNQCIVKSRHYNRISAENELKHWPWDINPDNCYALIEELEEE